MICFKCDSGKDAAFMKEFFPCAHCTEDNLMEYNVCPDCGWIWRSVNGIPSEDSQMHIEDLGAFSSMVTGAPMELTEDEEAIMANITKHIEKVEKMRDGEASMLDYVHECLNCNSTAVDVMDGKYTCRDCDFEWEIVSFE